MHRATLRDGTTAACPERGAFARRAPSSRQATRGGTGRGPEAREPGARSEMRVLREEPGPGGRVRRRPGGFARPGPACLAAPGVAPVALAKGAFLQAGARHGLGEVVFFGAHSDVKILSSRDDLKATPSCSVV